MIGESCPEIVSTAGESVVHPSAFGNLIVKLATSFSLADVDSYCKLYPQLDRFLNPSFHILLRNENSLVQNNLLEEPNVDVEKLVF